MTFESNEIKVTPELIKRYAVPGPRYTSYPTAVEFQSEFQEDSWLKALREEFSNTRLAPLPSYRGLSDSISLYFHLPFCKSLCYFCACTKVIAKDRSVVNPYLDALLLEISRYAEIIGTAHSVEQIHWGGGTPNYLAPSQMERLHRACIDKFSKIGKDADISVEIDPRTITLDHLQTLRRLGFNRVSLGVQDFNPEVQELVNRIQPYELTRKVCDRIRELDFGGINIDLIYGLPNQSREGFSTTIDRVLEIRPHRIALYGYAHVTWIKKVQKALEKSHLPTPDERIELFMLALSRLTEAGYVHIGMDHFSLPEDSLAIALHSGKLNRNFMGYTSHRGARLIGMGASSISCLPAAFGQNIKDVNKYQKLSHQTTLAIERGLFCTVDDRIRGELIESLLCHERIDIKRFEKAFDIQFSEYFRDGLAALAPLQADGLVDISEGVIGITKRGALFARNIAMCFDSYLAAHRQRQKPVFSQAI